MAFKADAAAETKRALTFAGFVGVSFVPEDERVLQGRRAAWEAGASAPVRVSFRKPAATAATTATAGVNGGSAKNASTNGVSNGNGVAPPAPAAKKTWKLALDDDDDGGGGFGGGGGSGMFGVGAGGEDGEDDLVDEDALLEGSAPVKRASELVRAFACCSKLSVVLCFVVMAGGGGVWMLHRGTASVFSTGIPGNNGRRNG